MAPRTRAGKESRVPTRKRSRSPATRAQRLAATPRSSPPPARRTPSASSGRDPSASRWPRSTESAMRSTGGRTYRASHFLWSPHGEPLTPLRDLRRLSLEPLMDQSAARGLRSAAAQPSRCSLVVDAAVMSRAPRPWVAKLNDQRMRTSSRFWKPIRYQRWTSSQVAQARKPLSRTPLMSATAAARPIVARLPLLR
jgi:hypothetical protein